jgi:hypothetical protein
LCTMRCPYHNLTTVTPFEDNLSNQPPSILQV